MASKQDTVDFIIDQLGSRAEVTAKKMFGEYGLYLHQRIVAVVADDQLFMKPTDGGRSYIGKISEAPPYPGAKNWLLIDGDRWEDGEWLAGLFQVTASELPLPAPKKPKTPKAAKKAVKKAKA